MELQEIGKMIDNMMPTSGILIEVQKAVDEERSKFHTFYVYGIQYKSSEDRAKAFDAHFGQPQKKGE